MTDMKNLAARKSEGENAVRALLGAFESHSIDRIGEIFAEGATFEAPLINLQIPVREIETALMPFIGAMTNLRFRDLVVEPLLESGAYIATYRGSAVISRTGLEYRQAFIARFDAKDGKLTRFVEYFSPLAFYSAFGIDESRAPKLP